jgi:mercuric ion transport protein
MAPSIPTGRRLPIARNNAARVIGGVGVLSCVLCCISIPGVVAALSALGLGFLRNDRVLFPASVVSLLILMLTLARSRKAHSRNAPLAFGTLAAAWMLAGLKTSAPFGTVAAITGAMAIITIVTWDWQLQRSRS